ncbi:gap junction delta-2 protein-like [Alosa sapidissima]|uniref:gap junction delta-2 protein-like n=1 Tax=Alosa sapidissima TaxID=34773 RepID=UPI001C09BFD2|nr:gap junction delta-2 protein-like [Alosa sapidissima]XP_041918753.1 gap junction delta-2 protein-like [Alosa sapidissima]XP_041918754.1 gap junction delta-2 protein-like [Alosa sapidissima]XP_041918755.1 gap junction delta-2 protein-like [Alosa sapidissima]
MGDWSILGRFLTEVQNHSTVIGKIWLTMLLIFRILLVTLVGDAVYSDEQSKFTCNTLQPGCNNVCYDTFAPVSHLRFWVFQIVLVSTPSIFYIVYVLHKIAKDDKLELETVHVQSKRPVGDYLGQVERGEGQGGQHYEEEWGPPQEDECAEQSLLDEDYREVGKDPTQLSSQVLLTYIVHVVLRSIMEITFLVGQYYLFGFEVPHLFRCETYPCPTRTDCFVSRATEKTIFLNFMFSISLGCFLLNIVELHYLGWVYIFRVLCSACSTCCRPERGPAERISLYADHNPLLLQLKHSLRGHLILQSPAPDAQEKVGGGGGGGGLLAHAPAISFETDSTVECTSKRSPEDRERMRVKLANVAKLGRTKKSWL